MVDSLRVQKLHTHVTGTEPSTKTQDVGGQDGGRKVASLIKQFDGETSNAPKLNGPKTDRTPPSLPKERTVNLTKTSVLRRPGRVFNRPQLQSTTAPKQTGTTYNYQEYVQKFGSKTANLYEIERLGVKVPERSPVDSKDIFNHLEKQDKDGVIQKSWDAMKKNGKVDDKNLKAITDKIEEIFDSGDFPFTPEQVNWIEKTMAGKIIIARSTGDEDSADTPNAGGNESVLFVEPNRASVQTAMKEVVLSYFGADSLRNRIVGDGMGKVLEGLPKMPVLLMEMIAEPIKGPNKVDMGEKPPIGIAMSTDKLEFTGGEDFHFVSVSSAVGPGVNEGSGRIEVDETFVMQAKDGTPLLIYQQPSVKEERIRAVKGEGGKITHQLEKNSKELAYQPSLSRDEVRSLVTSSDKIKTLNGGKTTEVEAVVGGDGTINFVQHRGIPDPKSKVDPTYVSTDKASGHSQTFGYTTVVPKSGDALVITDWRQVCFAETMKEAEAMFDWKGGTQKIVIVRQPDCSNSHPAVNFGSYKTDLGDGKKEPNPIPCLVVPNYGELLALKKNALAPNKPLIVDGQTQKLFVWKDDSFNGKEAILDGRISHHIGLDTGVNDKDVAALVGKLKTTASKDLAPLAKDLTSTLETYQAKITAYEKLLTKNADTIHNSDGLKIRLETLKGNFAEVSRALNEVVKGTDKYTFEPGTHGRLLLVKFLESSLHDVVHFQDLIDVEKSASMYLRAAKGSPIDKPIFGDQVGAVKDVLTGPLALKWKRVLTLAEQSKMTPEEVSDFKAMMEGLDKLGVTANWMSTVFDKKYGELMPTDRRQPGSAVGKAKELINELVNDYKTTAGVLRKQQGLQKNLAEVERGIADFATPSKFDKAFANLKELAKPFIEEEWPSDLNDNPLKKAVAVQTLGRLIEVYDASIKTLKGGALPTDQLVAKELEMLDTFSALFESLFTKISIPGDNPNTKPGFLKQLKEATDQIKQQVRTMDVKELEKQSRCGKDFNVNTALYSSLGKTKPSNVEELFTTLHQSLEEIRSGLMVGGSDYNIDLPKEMQSLLATIPKLAMQTAVKRPGVLVGRDITSTGVTYTYNMPVLDHGIKIRASYEKPKSGEANGKTTIELDFWAANDGDRLEYMAKLAGQFSFGTEPLDDPSRRNVVWGKEQFKAKFELRSEQDVQRVTTLINHLNAYSLMTGNGAIYNVERLKWVVGKQNDLTSGVFSEKRRFLLNDFLNVALGTVKGNVKVEKYKTSEGEKTRKLLSHSTTDYSVRLVWPQPPLSFVNAEDGNAYTLDLAKPKFGLPDQVFTKLPPDVSDEAKKTVLQGSRQFTFDYGGKSYALDLTKDDLGLSAGDRRDLALGGKRLGALRDQLSLAWDNATVYLKGKDATQFRSNWTDFIYGAPMAFSEHSALPELDLWKAMSTKSTRGSDLKTVDKAFKKALESKYALHDAQAKLAERGSFASPQDKQGFAKALQSHYKELSKIDLVCRGYCEKKWAGVKKLRADAKKLSQEGKAAETNGNAELAARKRAEAEEKNKLADGKQAQAEGHVKALRQQTEIQKKSIENQMLVLGMTPESLSPKQARGLAFSRYLAG